MQLSFRTTFRSIILCSLVLVLLTGCGAGAAPIPAIDTVSAAATKTEAATTIAARNSASNASKNEPEAIWRVVSDWQESKDSKKNSSTTTYFTQLEATLRNNGSKELTTWTASLKLPEDTKIDQIWNGKHKLSKGLLTITPESYNKVIAPDAEVQLGIIIKTNKKFELPSTGKANSKPTATSPAKPKATPASTPSPSKSPQPSGKAGSKDWLTTKGNQIVDQNGNEVWLTGLNWFGYNTGTGTFDGLWNASLESSLAEIADRGFNVIRLPISTELLLQWRSGKPPAANFNEHENPALKGKNSLQIFDYMLEQARGQGLKIIVDNHSADTDAMGHLAPLWTSAKVSEKDMLTALEWVAKRYKDNETIIGIDLKNEPHGKPSEKGAIWNNSKSERNWRYVAEKAAGRVLAANPNLLIFVEGIEAYPKDVKKNGSFASTNDGDYYFNWWGGNLRGVKDYPIDLGSAKLNAQIVYSPHDYGPAVHMQPWFKKKFTYASLKRDVWQDNWLFIHEDKIAPLLIGEWGGFMTEPNLSWMKHMKQLIIDNRLHHTFWCFNANSGDTGGLVKDDFKTWDEQKYTFVKPTLWQYKGKFVGLSQTQKLGKKGLTVVDAYKTK